MCGGGMTSVFLTSWLRPCRQCIQIITFSFFFFFFYSTFLQNLNFYQITTEPRIHGEQYETLTSFRDARSAIGWWITRVPSNGESEPSWSRLLGTRCEVSYWTPGSVSQPARPPRLGCSAPLKMLNWWAYGAVQWKKEGEPPVFFFVTLFHCRHTQKKKQNNNTELNHVVSVWCRRCSRVPPPPPRSSAGFPPCARRWQAGRTMLLRRFKGKKAPDGITTHGRASATPRRVRVQPGGELLLLLR